MDLSVSKTSQRFFCLLLCILMLFSSISSLATVKSHAEGSLKSISFMLPAIRANEGETIDLSDYSVELIKGSITSAEKITWTSDSVAITDGKVFPTTKGVYTLKASFGNTSRNIYLVVKRTDESEYVLYEESYDSASVINDYSTIQKTTDAKAPYIENGCLVLDASASTNAYLRVLLPTFLKDFGNYTFEQRVTISAYATSTNWTSVMYRIKNNDYPYWQTCTRANLKASNGVEIAERTSQNKWNVTHTGSYTSSFSPSDMLTVKTEVNGTNVAVYIDGRKIISSNTVPESLGAVGFQAKGAKVLVDNIKITLPDGEPEESKNINVTQPASNIIDPPTVIAKINSLEDLNRAAKELPATALMTVDGSLDVVSKSGEKIETLDGALKKLDGKIIPAFFVGNIETAEKLAKKLEELKVLDAFVVSDNGDIIKAARKVLPMLRGVLDFSGSIPEYKKIAELGAAANSSGSRVVILPPSIAKYEDVELLQRSLITVFVNSESGTLTETIANITSGANGILTSDTAGLKRCFTEYFNNGTIIRTVNIIGHRGVPSLAQENSLASAVKAYELGATMIENDIYLTRDGVIVVMHDSTLDRTTNGEGNIESKTYEELKQYSINVLGSVAPEPIPTLEDYFKEFKGKDATILIEIKSKNVSIISALAKLIKKYDILDQVAFITFNYTLIDALHASIPGASVGYLTSANLTSEEDPTSSVMSILGTLQQYGTTFNPSYNKGALGSNFILAAAHRGITVWPWTVNNKTDLDKYIGYGISGVTTNYSQYVSKYVRRLTASSSEVTFGVGQKYTFDINTVTYDRSSSRANSAFLKVIEGNETVKYEDGALTATKPGEATVIFGQSYSLSTGKKCYVYTQPVKINVTDEGDTVFASFTDSDGKSVTLYGDEIKTPESVLTPVKGKAFAGWLSKDKKLLVAPGTTIKLDKNVEFDALYINFEQLYGAAVSYGDKTTLKFTAYVENDQLNSLKKLVGSVDLGMEIGKSGESTSSKKSTKTALGSSGKLYFYGVTDEINKEDFNKDFIAQAYIDITYSDGTTRRVYAQNDADANVRSVARIAKAALSDISDSEDSVYKYKTSEGKFSPYSEDERKHLLEKAES